MASFPSLYLLFLITSFLLLLEPSIQQSALQIQVDIRGGCKADKPTWPLPGKHIIIAIANTTFADFISFHFTYFKLPKNYYLMVRAAEEKKGSRRLYINGTGALQNDFMPGALPTSSVIVEFGATSEADPRLVNGIHPFDCYGFQSDYYMYKASQGSQEGLCGQDDTIEAACAFALDKTIFAKSNPVARLLIYKAPGEAIYCTGWILGCESHVMTDAHCISKESEAQNTEFEFMAQDKCGISCQHPLGCPGVVEATSATIVYTSPSLDFTLLKLHTTTDLSAKYGYLQLRRSGAVLHERVYLPQHPLGYGKRVSLLNGGTNTTIVDINATTDNCGFGNVAYDCDTYRGSSGSPVLGYSDHNVVALHKCDGGCENAGVSTQPIITMLERRLALPRCATDSTPTLPTRIKINGTIRKRSDGETSIDLIQFHVKSTSKVEIDILSFENAPNGSYIDVNNDCDASYLDSQVHLFRNPGDGVDISNLIASNDDDTFREGFVDGSLSIRDSFLSATLREGNYILAIGVSLTRPEDVSSGWSSSGSSASMYSCGKSGANHGNYEITFRSNSNLQLSNSTIPSSIGSRCGASTPTTGPAFCRYHNDFGEFINNYTLEGTIFRREKNVSVDHIYFNVTNPGKLDIQITSFKQIEKGNFVDVMHDCSGSYIDSVMYLFKENELVDFNDDDMNYMARNNSIGTEDSYLSLDVGIGMYTLAIGRYPLTKLEALQGIGLQDLVSYTPQSCGSQNDSGNYKVAISSTHNITLSFPTNSYVGNQCNQTSNTIICQGS